MTRTPINIDLNSIHADHINFATASKDGTSIDETVYAQSAVKGDLNTHDITMTNGKYAGERLTRIPISYIRWMANESNHFMKEYAKAELKRRNYQLPSVELSGHAIDNASLRVWQKWCELRNQNEGIYSWLTRITLEAIEKGEKLESGKIKYLNMKFVVAQGEEFPVLKTIMK